MARRAPTRSGPGRDQRARRRSQRVGAVGVVLAGVLPVWLWHDVLNDVIEASDLGLTRLTGFAPWALMGLGLLCAIPIAIEELRDRGGRFHRRGTGAWAGWGVTLYLLGFALATQVAQIHALHS